MALAVAAVIAVSAGLRRLVVMGPEAFAETPVVSPTDASVAARQAPDVRLGVLPSTAPTPTSNDPTCPEGYVLVPGGRVSTPADNTPDAATVVTEVHTFCMAAREVTVEEFRTCVNHENEARRCLPPSSREAACNYNHPERVNAPINCVGWGQAMDYCSSRNAELPTEAQWVLAAFGATRRYPWGDQEPGELCWSGPGPQAGDRSGTCAVDEFPFDTTPEGIHGMAANVVEMTSNLCEEDGESGIVVRGGSYGIISTDWFTRSGRLCSTVRQHPARGFRCAINPRHQATR